MDLERIARDFLRERGFACEFYVPDPIPASLVTVKRTAKPGSTAHHTTAMLTLQAWATSRGRAAELAGQAVDALVGRGEHEQSGGLAYADDDITGCYPENGPYRWDDPDVRDRSRWQATVSVETN